MVGDSAIQKLIKNLEAHALSLKGAVRGVDGEIELIRGLWSQFLRIHKEPKCFAHLPVLKERLKQLRRHKEVTKSDWLERDGHAYMNVSLVGNLTEEMIKEWIDEAHRIVLNKLDAEQRFVVLLGDRPYDEKVLIDEIINFYELRDRAKEIKRVAKPALLLQTKKQAEKSIPVGASKLGGDPDLVPNEVWPTHSSGKPLSFLVQVNLGELAAVGAPFKNLPTKGLLSIFSVWGWMVDGDADPHVPNGPETPEWTQCVFTKQIKNLARRVRPKQTPRFKAAPFEMVPIKSFPMHTSEPSIARLGLSKDLAERYDRFAEAFRAIQTQHYAPKSHGSSHQLGGYGLFQQHLPSSIASGAAELFLQIGTDEWASSMMWGDGGELSLIGKAVKLRNGILDGLVGELQGG